MPENRSGARGRAHDARTQRGDHRPSSKSPKHRGYREDAPKKQRGDREDREQRGGRERSNRPNWEPREQRGRSGGPAFRTRGGDRPQAGRFGDRDRDRGANRGDGRPSGRWQQDAGRAHGGRAQRDHSDRRFDRDERAPRRFASDDRAPRRFDRDERGGRRDRDEPRRFDRDERAGRRDRDDRPRVDRDDRAPRRVDRDDRAPHRDRDARQRFDRDDRAPRRDRDGRPRVDRDERPRDDRAPRRFDRDDRAPRRDRDERRPFDRDDRAPRRDRDDRTPHRDRDERSRDDRAPRGDRDERPRFDRGDRTSRRDRNERPRFDRDERPRVDRDERPRRDSIYYPSRESAPFVPHDDVVLEKLEATMITADEASESTFADLGLGPGIVGALGGFGADRPFPIQAATIPDVLAGRDVLGRGRTGSGKTIAFGAPMVEHLLRNRPEKRAVGRAPRGLILAPTRELAMQIDRTVQSIARAVGIFTTVIVGGVRQGQQVQALRRGVDILIGTPGRIEDLVEQGWLDLSKVEIAVLDEADHMCDLGFLEPVQRILRMTRPGNQKLLFSATLDKGVAALVGEFLPDPAVHEVAGEDQASSTIDHKVLVVDRYDKDAVLEQIVRNPGKILVFTRTRSYAERLAEQFEDAGIATTSLHGDLNQGRRTRNLDLLKRGKVDVLVATDVAARGIHVDDISLVVQADPPDEYKTYMHRAGRTGRAGRAGTVVTVIAPSRRRRTQELLERAEIEAPMIPVVPGDDILDSLTAGAEA